MLSEGMDRRPISRPKQLAVVSLLLLVFCPLMGMTAQSTAQTSDATHEDRMAVAAVLKSFYAALSDGSSFQTVREEFLTSDYFDDSSLTKENLGKSIRLPILPIFENTTCCITEDRPGVVQKVRSRIMAVQRDGDELVATMQIDITGFCLDKRPADRNADGTVLMVMDKDSGRMTAIQECPVVDSLSQRIRLRREDDAWRISQFKGGVTLMCMDENSPYGPILLVWINNIDDRTTPVGSAAFKVTPRDLVPDAHHAEFVLEQ